MDINSTDPQPIAKEPADERLPDTSGSASLMLTADEAKLLRHGICSFDSACSGVSSEELAECADAVVSLVAATLKSANESPMRQNANNPSAPI